MAHDMIYRGAPGDLWLAAQRLAAVVNDLPNATAVIAGGCCRDYIMRRPIRDIDIFITFSDPKGSMLDGDIVGAVDAELAPHSPLKVAGTPALLGSNGYTAAFSEVVGTLTYGDPRGYPINVIVLREWVSLHGLLERMDFGICQAAYLPHQSRFVMSLAFVNDRASRTFTYRRSADDPHHNANVCRSHKRFERLSTKYPGWSLAMPTTEDACDTFA